MKRISQSENANSLSLERIKMKHKWILAVVVCAAVIAVSILYINESTDITGAAASGPIDLKTFNYSAVTDKSDFPQVNVTGVIDNICMIPSLPLWNRAGGGKAGGQISVTVRGCPGTSMWVTEAQEYENTVWYRVQKSENQNGFQMWWDGWITDKVILQGPLPVSLEEYQKQQK